MTSFSEKPPSARAAISGGFFVVQARVLRPAAGDAVQSLEREPLRELARDGELVAYRHDGFWQCMDNSRDYQHLNQLWAEGQAVAAAADRALALAAWRASDESDRPGLRNCEEKHGCCNRSGGTAASCHRLHRPGRRVDDAAPARRAAPRRRAGPRPRRRQRVVPLRPRRAHRRRPRRASRTTELIERTLAEYEIQTVFHLAAQTIVGVANRSRCPRSRATSRGPGACSKPPAAAATRRK